MWFFPENLYLDGKRPIFSTEFVGMDQLLKEPSGLKELKRRIGDNFLMLDDGKSKPTVNWKMTIQQEGFKEIKGEK